MVFLGARGSGEEPAAPDPATPPVFEGDSHGFGSANSVIAAKMATDIVAARPSSTFSYLAVQYSAVQVPSFDQRVSYPSYLASVYDGVDKMRQLFVTESARCPASSFVLIGNSQGALVIDLMLDLVTQADQQRRIAGVVMLANPARTIGSPGTLWETAQRPAVAGVTDAAGMWTDFRPGFDTPLPTWIAPRTISMCHQGDMVCAFRPGASLDPHLSYTTDELYALAVWQVDRVIGRLGAPAE